MSFFSHLVPTYGMWGGPGWSGGQYQNKYENTDWSVKPVDSMDSLFKNHDKQYQQAIHKFDEGLITIEEKSRLWKEADKKLQKNLDDLAKDPNRWPVKPSNYTYAWIYRKCAIFLFGVKINFNLFY